MSEITVDKTHALLEKLAEYVVTEVATKKELAQKAGKKDLEKLEKKVDTLIDGMDSQAKEHEIFRLEQAAISKTLDRHEKRITTLEAGGAGLDQWFKAKCFIIFKSCR